jgi:two-component system sensor histidine kinase ChiS
MLLRKTLFWSIILISFSLSACKDSRQKPPVIKNGILDLRSWDFEKAGNVRLDGNWQFFWKQLYTLSSVKNGEIKPSFLYVPDGWNQLNKDKSAWEQGDGYGTYYLQILLNNKHKKLGLYTPMVSTAMNVIVNDSLIYSAGTVGTSSKSSVPGYNPRAFLVTPATDTLHLILQISNFHYRKGGAWDTFVIGNSESILKNEVFNLIQTFFLVGGLLLIFLYFLIISLIIQNDFSIIFFSLFCLTTALLLLCSDRYHIQLFIHPEWIWLVRIEAISNFVLLPSFTGFVYFSFIRQIPLWFFRIVLTISSIFIFITLVTSVKLFSYLVVPFEVFTILAFTCIFYFFLKSLKAREQNAGMFFAGFVCLLATIINDILYLNNILLTGRILFLGICLFILILAVMLARRLSRAFLALEENNKQLSEKNQEIAHKNEELTKLNEELDAFVYRTSHDLRSPITSVIGLLEIAKYEQDYVQLHEYFDMGKKSLRRMDGLISDIISYAKNSRVDVEYEKIDFAELSEEIFANFAFLENSTLIDKKCIVEGNPDFYSDKRRITFILNNLVSNAIKYHDIQKAYPFIHIYIKQIHNQLCMEIKDNGQGISKEHLNNIFQMFYRATTDSIGAGLGLYIVRETVNKLQGTIQVDSVLHEGTVFQLTLPNMYDSADNEAGKN